MQHQVVLALLKLQLWCLKTHPSPSLTIKPTNMHKTAWIPSHPEVVLPNTVSSEHSVDERLYFKMQIQLSFIFSTIIRVK